MASKHKVNGAPFGRNRGCLSMVVLAIIVLALTYSAAFSQVVHDYTAPPNSASMNTKRLDQNIEYTGINADKQNVDSDLTAIAAIATTSYGRAFLGLTDAAASRSYIGAGTGNGDALVANTLAQFASTTSAQLAGVLSNETGTGLVVFGTSPNITTPTGIVKGDVGLGNVDNTSDTTKLLAIDTSAEIKALVTDETGSGALVFGTSPNITTPTGIVKGDVGLGNVDNTSDATKLLAIDTSAELRTLLTDEVGTGPLMFGLISTMSDDLSCTGSQVVRRNAGDTAFECASLASGATFIGLTDVPATFAGQGLKIVRVNAGATALEFVTASGGGDALVANPLSQFAATTSLQLKNTLSDETGSGAAVFATSPALVTPTGIVKGDVGLGNVDNTSDATKFTSPTLTGTPLSTTAAVDTNTTQIATTAYVVAQAASANPVMDGAAAPGTSLRYARGDHVHPTDTTKANLASPTFTGTPLSTTAAVDTNTTQIATTAYVVGQSYAKLASPTFTGTPAAPTAAVDTSTTQLATTAYVVGQGYAKLASPTLTGTPLSTTAAVDTNTTQIATTAYVIGQGYAKTTALSGKKTETFLAGAMISRVTNGPSSGTSELATNKENIRSLDFDTTTQEFAQIWWPTPKNWNLGTITGKFYWSHAATATNFGVVWAMECVAISDQDTQEVAVGTSQLIADTGGTTNTLYVTSETPAITVAGTPAAEDMVMCQVKRVPADAGDTMAIDARLQSVKITYTTNALTEN